MGEKSRRHRAQRHNTHEGVKENREVGLGRHLVNLPDAGSEFGSGAEETCAPGNHKSPTVITVGGESQSRPCRTEIAGIATDHNHLLELTFCGKCGPYYCAAAVTAVRPIPLHDVGATQYRFRYNHFDCK